MAQDQRRRRAERVRSSRAKNLVPKYKWPILGVAVLVVLVGVIAAFPGILPQGPAPKKFAHEHPSFAIFIEGEHVSFNHPDYDISRVSDRVHMHYSGDPARMATWHVEAKFPDGIPDIPISSIFAQYGVTMRPGYLKLDTKGGHNGTEWADAAPKVWQLWVSKVDRATGQHGEWTRIEGDYTQYAPRDLDKILITYGNLTAEELASQQARVPLASP